MGKTLTVQNLCNDYKLEWPDISTFAIKSSVEAQYALSRIYLNRPFMTERQGPQSK